MRAQTSVSWWWWVAGLLVAWPSSASPPVSQLATPQGCVSEDGTGGACANGLALDGVTGTAISPDGRHAYVTAGTSGAVAAFDRDASTGALSQKEGAAACISDSGTGGSCADGVALVGAASAVVSFDGKNVYVVASTAGAVSVFDRNLATGNLTQKAGTSGCVSESGTGGDCVDGVGLASTIGLALSPDGRNLYTAASASDAIAVFDRDPATGTLLQKGPTLGCVSRTGTNGSCAVGIQIQGVLGVAVAPDGRNVYTAAITSDAVAIFDRDLATGVLTQKDPPDGCVSETDFGGYCADGRGLLGALSVAVSPDGRNVYAVSQDSDAITVFDRDPVTGALTQKAGTLGCISEDGTGGECADGVGLDETGTVVVSPDGRSVYVSTETSDGLAVFDRDPETGVLTQQAGIAACTTLTGSGGACALGTALDFPLEVAVSPDGNSLYVAANASDAVAVFARQRVAYDIDGDGEITSLTDGLLLLRYAFGFTGATLITGAVDPVNCTRCTAPAIAAYMAASSAP